MKISIVVGGRWHAFDLARELNKKGCLYRLITNYPYWFVKRWGIPREKVVSLQATFWIVKAIYKFGGESLMMRCQWVVHRWFAKRAVKYLRGSDVVHGWSQWSKPALAWCKENGIPTVLERSSAHILEQGRILDEEYQRHGLKWTATHQKIVEMELEEYEICSCVAVPSLFVERSFLKKDFPRGKLFRNPLGVDIRLFNPEIGSGLNPPGTEGLKVMYAGSLSIRKGIPDLIEGFKQARIIDSHLTLVGGITCELKQLLSEQTGNITVLGHRPQHELVAHYKRNHCFVLASVEEGMAMVQMQALAMGLPLISTSNTGGEDLLRIFGSKGIDHGMGILEFPAGFIIPIHKPQAIAHCLKRLQEEQGLWERKQAAAIRLAKTELSWSGYGQRSIENYRHLLQK